MGKSCQEATDWNWSVEAMYSNLASNSAHSKGRSETVNGQYAPLTTIPGDQWNPFESDIPFTFTAVVAAMVKSR